jgi:phage FluMu protein Com
MNIRCSFCQTPYTLSRVQMLDALQELDAHKLTHYDAHCPRCKRATKVERKRMEIFFPNWRDALKQFEAEMKSHPQQEAPLPASQSASAAVADSAPPSNAKVKPAAKAKPEPKAQSAAQKAPAKKPATKKK